MRRRFKYFGISSLLIFSFKLNPKETSKLFCSYSELLFLKTAYQKMTEKEKYDIILKIKDRFSKEKEVSKVIIFGSFLKMENPNDIDIAVFQDSNEMFLKLSLKYRKLIRDIAERISLDIVPVKLNPTGVFLDEINNGEIIYER